MCVTVSQHVRDGEFDDKFHTFIYSSSTKTVSNDENFSDIARKCVFGTIDKAMFLTDSYIQLHNGLLSVDKELSFKAIEVSKDC